QQLGARHFFGSRNTLRMRQGTRSVASYTIDFRTVAAGSGWKAYVQGLSEELKDKLAARDTLRTRRLCTSSPYALLIAFGHAEL
ncbi:mucin-5AC-like, partial [Tachysurus ichikawai]